MPIIRYIACDVYLIVSIYVDFDLSYLTCISRIFISVDAKLHNIAENGECLEPSDVNAIRNNNLFSAQYRKSCKNRITNNIFVNFRTVYYYIVYVYIFQFPTTISHFQSFILFLNSNFISNYSFLSLFVLVLCHSCQCSCRLCSLCNARCILPYIII